MFRKLQLSQAPPQLLHNLPFTLKYEPSGYNCLSCSILSTTFPVGDAGTAPTVIGAITTTEITVKMDRIIAKNLCLMVDLFLDFVKFVLLIRHTFFL
jgi:hypothetical protein